jgi:hypothetical protein
MLTSNCMCRPIFASQGLRFGSPFPPPLADLEYSGIFAYISSITCAPCKTSSDWIRGLVAVTNEILKRESSKCILDPLFTNLFSIIFLYFFIISSLFPYFNLFVSIFIQSYVHIKLHVSILYRY